MSAPETPPSPAPEPTSHATGRTAPDVGPDQTTATGDPGDETGRRFRYQWTYAAVVCCSLLDASRDVLEVFCEHHEDILIKHGDGKFSGLQIKTRATDQDPWCASDEQVFSAFARFAKLEAQYGTHFRQYRFLTNHPLLEAQTGRCIRHIIAEINAGRYSRGGKHSAKAFFLRLVQLSDCSKDHVLSAIGKCSVDDSLPKLADIETRLTSALAENWNNAEQITFPALTAIARRLSDECGRASTLHHLELLPAYFPATTTHSDDTISNRIAGKKFNKERLLHLLDASITVGAALLSDPSNHIPPGSGTRDLLLLKLDTGGFSVVRRNSAEDLRGKADYLGIQWTQKHGTDKGLQRYNHVRSLVLTAAADAFDAARIEGAKFGPAMLVELRRRIEAKRLTGSVVFDCSNEHLEGIAYSLTAECKVHWSNERPWETRA